MSLYAENFIIISHRILFVCSTLCNIVASICLFKKAPEMQAEIKFYLYYMQVRNGNDKRQTFSHFKRYAPKRI